MTETQEEMEFKQALVTIMPRLRIYALSLTRNADAANDLVQDTIVKALAGRKSFQPGTNMAAWLFRIQRNEFIDGMRGHKPSVPIDTAISNQLSIPPAAFNRLELRDFMEAFGFLNESSQRTLLMAAVEGLDYKTISNLTGVAIGTVKSRISRARDVLEELTDTPRSPTREL